MTNKPPISKIRFLMGKTCSLSKALAFIFFFLGMSLSTFAQWLGTDLSFSFNKEGQVEVKLVKYYVQGSEKEISSKQGVSFFEAKSGPPKTDLLLKLDTTIVVRNVFPLACLQGTPPIYQKAVYKGVISLPTLSGGYNLVWQSSLPKGEHWENISDQEATGVSLVCFVPEKSPEMINHYPTISDPPVFFNCPGEKQLAHFDYVDPEMDSLYFKFTEIYTESSLAYPKPPGMLGSGDRDESYYQFPREAPPFKPLPFTKGYSSSAPFGKDGLQHNLETKLMTFSIAKAGFYLAGMSIVEHKNKMKSGEMQRVFRLSSGMIISNNNPK